MRKFPKKSRTMAGRETARNAKGRARKKGNKRDRQAGNAAPAGLIQATQREKFVAFERERQSQDTESHQRSSGESARKCSESIRQAWYKQPCKNERGEVTRVEGQKYTSNLRARGGSSSPLYPKTALRIHNLEAGVGGIQ